MATNQPPIYAAEAMTQQWQVETSVSKMMFAGKEITDERYTLKSTTGVIIQEISSGREGQDHFEYKDVLSDIKFSFSATRYADEELQTPMDHFYVYTDLSKTISKSTNHAPGIDVILVNKIKINITEALKALPRPSSPRYPAINYVEFK